MRHKHQIPPTRRDMHSKEKNTQAQTNASVFDEQLQPVIVRMHRPGIHAVIAIALRQLVEHV